MRPHYVLLIHGIGDAKANFSGPFEDNLLEVFETEVTRISGQNPSGKPDVRKILWSPATEEIQGKLWEKLFPDLGSGEDLPWWKPWAKLRYFVVHYLGDAVAYDEPPGTSKYLPMHEKAWEVIDQCVVPASLTIVAHSLGSVIVSDLFADAVDPTRPGHTKAWPPQLKLTNFITIGSPLPLYAVQFEKLEHFHPIRVQDQDYGLWINLYDPQDVLGFPLRPLNNEYREAVLADKVINAGSWWNPSSATPLSHGLYWEDATVAEVVGRKVALDWLRENTTGLNLQQEYDEYKSWVKE